jgi:hypothetical protein
LTSMRGEGKIGGKVNDPAASNREAALGYGGGGRNPDAAAT